MGTRQAKARKKTCLSPYKEPEAEMLQADDSSRVHGRTSREDT